MPTQSQQPWEVFRFCPRCGNKHEKPPSNPFQCASCNLTYFHNPGIGVGAIITNPNQEILLIRRGREPQKGKFSLPGGFVDLGEGIEEGLLREVLEEVNLVPNSIEYLCSFPNAYLYRDIDYQLADVFYVARVDSFESLQAQPGEVTGIEFHRFGEFDLQEMAFESNRRALRVFQEKQ